MGCVGVWCWLGMSLVLWRLLGLRNMLWLMLLLAIPPALHHRVFGCRRLSQAMAVGGLDGSNGSTWI